MSGCLPQDTPLRREGSGSANTSRVGPIAAGTECYSEGGAADDRALRLIRRTLHRALRLLALRGAEVLAVPAALPRSRRAGPLGATLRAPGRGKPGLCRRTGQWGRKADDMDLRTLHHRSTRGARCSPNAPDRDGFRASHAGPRPPRSLSGGLPALKKPAPRPTTGRRARRGAE